MAIAGPLGDTMRLLSFAALCGLLLLSSLATPARAQVEDLTIATVIRPPFSMVIDNEPAGFSVELWDAIAKDLGVTYRWVHHDSFTEMLGAVENGDADGAIANISITAARERVLDFSQPIFESGLQIMLPYGGSGGSILTAFLTRDILYAILIAVGLLFGGGMLMWAFERRKNEFFDRPAGEALFPSFWWALNLVVNGGFEERMPRSRPGRVFAVFLVVASLFIVSVFVAKITAAMTVNAIQSNVESVNDLDGRRVGTIRSATAADYLDTRAIAYRGYDDLDGLLKAFSDGRLDAVFFDGPILAYFARTNPDAEARVVDRVFRPENYGMALAGGSPLREAINQSLLKLREDGTYDSLLTKWFGASYGNR